MPVSIAPEEEVLDALVARINAGSGITYTLDRSATGDYQLTDDLASLTDLAVDVVHEASQTPNSQLNGRNHSSHRVRIWVRKKLPSQYTRSDIAPLALITRQIFERVDGYRTTRITVMEAANEDIEALDKRPVTAGVYSASILLRVEVEAP